MTDKINSTRAEQNRDENREFARQNYQFHTAAAIYEAQVGARSLLLLVAFLTIGVILLRPDSHLEIALFIAFGAIVFLFGIYVLIACRRSLLLAKNHLVDALNRED